MCNCGKKRSALTVTPRSIPIEVSHDTALWGPTLWRILHTLAEFTMYGDMNRFWQILLRNMRTTLPCPDCRAHFVAWSDSHPLTNIKTMPELRIFYRQWLLDLHNQVNVTKQSPTTPWTESQLTPTYGGDRTVRLQEVRNLITSMEAYFTATLIAALRKLTDLADRG